MNLAAFITGLKLESLAADLTTFIPGRALDDNAHIMLRFEGGAKGMLWASQVAPGNENCLRIRVYGDKGGLHLGPGGPELPPLRPLRRAPAPDPPRRRRIRPRGGPRDPHPVGPPRRLSRGLRQHLQRRRRADPCQPGGPHAGRGCLAASEVQDGVAGVKFIEAVVEFERQGRRLGVGARLSAPARP